MKKEIRKKYGMIRQYKYFIRNVEKYGILERIVEIGFENIYLNLSVRVEGALVHLDEPKYRETVRTMRNNASLSMNTLGDKLVEMEYLTTGEMNKITIYCYFIREIQNIHPTSRK